MVRSKSRINAMNVVAGYRLKEPKCSNRNYQQTADDDDFLVLDEIDVGIPVIINAHRRVLPEGPKSGRFLSVFGAKEQLPQAPFLIPA